MTKKSVVYIVSCKLPYVGYGCPSICYADKADAEKDCKKRAKEDPQCVFKVEELTII